MGRPGDPYLWFEVLRWGAEAPACPHCGAPGGRFLATEDGTARRTRTGASTPRRVWRCAQCRRQFSVLTGTVFEGTRVPLSVWAAVVAASAAGEHLSATEVGDRFGVGAEGARTMLTRTRLALAAVRAGRSGSGAADDPLARVLSLPAVEVERIRAASAPRVRNRGSEGPSADYR